MSTIKGIKAGTTTITATYGTLTSSVSLTVATIGGNVSYSASNQSIYCTETAAAMTSTDAEKTLTISTGPTSSTGQTVSCSTSPTVTKSSTSVSGWSVSSDGTTLTIPKGTASGTYSVTITANAAAITGSYNSASTTSTISVTITATSISDYGTVTAPSISQTTDFPAGGVTLTTSNADTYFTTGTSTQTITYNNGATRDGSITYAWSGSSTTISSLGTTSKNRTSISINTLTYTATGEGSKTNSNSVSNGYQEANSEGSIHYSKSDGSATGDVWTYGTPTKVTKSTSADLIHGGSDTITSSVSNNKQYWLKWTSGSYKEHNDTIAGTVGFAFDTCSTNSGSNDFTLGTVSNNSTTITHRDMGAITTDSVTDSCSVYAYNTESTSKQTSGTNNATWSITNTRTKVLDGIKTYGTPTAITVSGTDTIAANGGSCTVTSSVTNVRYWHYTYTDSNHNESANAHYSDEVGTVKWVIVSESTAVSGDRWSDLSATTGTSTKVTHSDMTTNAGTDSLTLQAQNYDDTTKVVTTNKVWSITNSITWNNPTLSVTPTSPYAMNVAGETKAITPSITQSGTYTSGSAATTNTTATYGYAIKTSKTGYSLASNNVTVTNNDSTSARNGFVVTVTATANGKQSTADITFNQAAGSKSYNTPTVTAYSYAQFAASGATKTPSTVTYSQVWTWNGVANSGGTLSTGGTLAYATSSTLPSGFTVGSDFATTGSVTWANRTTVTGDARDAKSYLNVTVTMNGVSSSAYTCTSCLQVANSLGTTKYKDISGTEGYNIVYVVPTVSIGTGLTAAGGSATVTCTVTNNTNWYQKYTSGSYTSQQTGTEAGTARWRITANGNSRFSEPTSGGSTSAVTGLSVATYATSTAVSHSTMTTNVTTDTVTVTAYNTGNSEKYATASADVTNAITAIHLSLNSPASLTDGTSNPNKYSLNYNSSATTKVTADYTSGTEGNDITSLLSASNYTSSTSGIVTIS